MEPRKTKTGHSCHTRSIVPDESQTAVPPVDPVGLAEGDSAVASHRDSTRRSAQKNLKSKGRRSSVPETDTRVPSRGDTFGTAHNVYYVKYKKELAELIQASKSKLFPHFCPSRH